MTAIRLLLENERVFKDRLRSLGYPSMTQSAWEWLCANSPRFKFQVVYGLVKKGSRSENRPIAVDFVFPTANEAMLFKLIWGGV